LELDVSYENKTSEPETQQERQLIEMAQQNPDEFQHLFNKYFDPIFNYALRRTCDVHIADDVTATTFLKALNQIKNFKWKGISFSAWLYRIATNEIAQVYRKTKRMTSLTSEVAANLKDERSSDTALLEAEELVARNEKFKQIHAALSRLKIKYQTALTLRYFEDKSIKEIAAILDMSENTVKTHIRRGLKELKEYYERFSGY
jgi:RNA polymerase sigma-70 factor (ECF subfamily)